MSQWNNTTHNHICKNAPISSQYCWDNAKAKSDEYKDFASDNHFGTVKSWINGIKNMCINLLYLTNILMYIFCTLNNWKWRPNFGHHAQKAYFPHMLLSLQVNCGGFVAKFHAYVFSSKLNPYQYCKNQSRY